MSVQRTLILRVLGVALAFGAAAADPTPSAGKIYSCIGKDGKKITQDHPIAECAETNQVEHNKDGSFKRVVPRQETEEERAAREARERLEGAERYSPEDLGSQQLRGREAMMRVYAVRAA